jgi:hypothetical protein
MQKDGRFRVVDDWALASDGVQWVLQHRSGRSWEALSFVRTKKDVLADCMIHKGAPPDVAQPLLESFEAWHEQFDPSGYLPTAPPAKTVMTASDGRNKQGVPAKLAAWRRNLRFSSALAAWSGGRPIVGCEKNCQAAPDQKAPRPQRGALPFSVDS